MYNCKKAAQLYFCSLDSLPFSYNSPGHNWGSEHDPDNTECSPSSSGGGKFIMYTYSVSGLESNNKVFVIVL